VPVAWKILWMPKNRQKGADQFCAYAGQSNDTLRFQAAQLKV
jgi:hypothetical protein